MGFKVKIPDQGSLRIDRIYHQNHTLTFLDGDGLLIAVDRCAGSIFVIVEKESIGYFPAVTAQVEIGNLASYLPAVAENPADEDDTIDDDTHTPQGERQGNDQYKRRELGVDDRSVLAPAWHPGEVHHPNDHCEGSKEKGWIVCPQNLADAG